MSEPFDVPTELNKLPVIGGPLGHTHTDHYGHPVTCTLATCPDAKTRLDDKMSFTQKDWAGEYRRTSSAWMWTPRSQGENPATDTINVARLPRHPSPKQMAKHAVNVAKRIDADGVQAIRKATVLAARGLAASRGGSRSSNPTTTVERAAGLTGDDGELSPPDPKLIGIDERLAQAHLEWDRLGSHLLKLYDQIFSHSSDDDHIPAGTGSCRRCNEFWRPTPDKPEDRIKSGYGAPCCYMNWWKLGRPDKTLYDRMSDDEIDAALAERNNEPAA